MPCAYGCEYSLVTGKCVYCGQRHESEVFTHEPEVVMAKKTTTEDQFLGVPSPEALQAATGAAVGQALDDIGTKPSRNGKFRKKRTPDEEEDLARKRIRRIFNELSDNARARTMVYVAAWIEENKVRQKELPGMTDAKQV